MKIRGYLLIYFLLIAGSMNLCIPAGGLHNEQSDSRRSIQITAATAKLICTLTTVLLERAYKDSIEKQNKDVQSPDAPQQKSFKDRMLHKWFVNVPLIEALCGLTYELSGPDYKGIPGAQGMRMGLELSKIASYIREKQIPHKESELMLPSNASKLGRGVSSVIEYAATLAGPQYDALRTGSSFAQYLQNEQARKALGLSSKKQKILSPRSLIYSLYLGLLASGGYALAKQSQEGEDQPDKPNNPVDKPLAGSSSGSGDSASKLTWNQVQAIVKAEPYKDGDEVSFEQLVQIWPQTDKQWQEPEALLRLAGYFGLSQAVKDILSQPNTYTEEQRIKTLADYFKKNFGWVGHLMEKGAMSSCTVCRNSFNEESIFDPLETTNNKIAELEQQLQNDLRQMCFDIQNLLQAKLRRTIVNPSEYTGAFFNNLLDEIAWEKAQAKKIIDAVDTKRMNRATIISNLQWFMHKTRIKLANNRQHLPPNFALDLSNALERYLFNLKRINDELNWYDQLKLSLSGATAKNQHEHEICHLPCNDVFHTSCIARVVEQVLCKEEPMPMTREGIILPTEDLEITKARITAQDFDHVPIRDISEYDGYIIEYQLRSESGSIVKMSDRLPADVVEGLVKLTKRISELENDENVVPDSIKLFQVYKFESYPAYLCPCCKKSFKKPAANPHQNLHPINVKWQGKTL